MSAICHHLNTTRQSSKCSVCNKSSSSSSSGSSKSSSCYCACSTAAAARLLGRLSSNYIAQRQLASFNPLSALLFMMTDGCKRPLEYYDKEGNELEQPCVKSRYLVASAAEYALIKIASHCDTEIREQMRHECLVQSWLGHNSTVMSMLF